MSQTRNSHVLIIADAVGLPSGMASTRRVLCLAQGLLHDGLSVEVILLRPTEWPDNIKNHDIIGQTEGIPYRYLSNSTLMAPTRMGRRMQEIRGLISADRIIAKLGINYEKPRVITYSRHLFTVIPVAWACHRHRIPMAAELCEWPETQPCSSSITRWRRQLFCRQIVRFANGFIPISRFIENRIMEHSVRLGRKSPMLRIPILVDAQEHFEQELLPFMHQPFLLFSGSSDYQKTIDFVLESFALIRRHYPSYKLVITGIADRAAQEFTAKLNAMGLVNHVEFPGFITRNALLTAYRKAEALLVPLFNDAQSQARFPTKLGEYLLAGRPVITSATGEIPEFLTDRQTAFLSPADSVQGFTDAVAAALSDPIAASRVGIAGRQFAQNNFDFRIHGCRLAKWLDILGHPEAGHIS